MTKEHIVIVGGSHAAAELSPALRQNGWKGDITIISADTLPPYHRPPLSKAYLNGAVSEEQLLIRKEAYYEKQAINLMLGKKVLRIDRDNCQLELDSGEVISYTKLALTTGASPRKIPLSGSDLSGVFYLRDRADVEGIKAYVGVGKSAVIIGGGYIGLETAASLRKSGMQVTLLEALPRVLERVTSAELSDFYTRMHREEGVEILTETTASEIVGDGKVEHVQLQDGTLIKADLVVIGIGVVPETALAEEAGLEVENGIVVDEYARTSDHNIVAAGDCSFHYNPIYHRHLRLESVQNANDQAKVAAKALCGELQAYHTLPWFWSDQYDVKLQIAGLSQGFDQVVFRGDSKQGRSFCAFYLAQGKLIAVDAINRPKEFMLCRRVLANGPIVVDPAGLADDAQDLKSLLGI